MAADPADSPKRVSSWSRVPEESAEPAEGVRPSAVAVLRSGAGRVAATIASGFRAGADALASPEGSDLAAALPGADLPEIGDGDAIAALALRLDREADFWRGVALRSLASAVWAERIAQIGSVLAGLGGLGLAVLAAFSALFGAADPFGRAVLLGCGAATLACGSALIAWISGRARATQRDIAHAALRRSDLAEIRLHRVTLVLAHRQAGIDNFAIALGRLEQDVG